MVDRPVLEEHVRQALLHLYDPPTLAATPLAAELIAHGTLRSGEALHDLLLGAIQRLKPPPGAPHQSHGWRCYRYLYLRYVDCENHDAIAHDLQISIRHAHRVHHKALQVLTSQLFAEAALSPALPVTAHEPANTVDRADQRRSNRMGPSVQGPASFESELAKVGSQPPDQAVDVGDVIRGVCRTLTGIATTQGVRLSLTLDDQLPPVRVNRIALRQMLLNLLLSLIRTATQGVVRLRAERDGDAILVRLSRVSGETMAHAVYDDSSLAAGRLLAKLQGVPLDVAVDSAGPAALSLRLPVGVAPTILIIDDNPDIGRLFQRMLAHGGFHGIPLRTADRALRVAREKHPDLILLDVVMPGRDGWEVYATLKEDPETTAIPIVVCSVLPDRDLALSLGAAGFLAKPVSRNELNKLVNQIVRPQ